MSHPNRSGAVAERCYQLCSKVPNDRWKEFARVKLELADSKIDDIIHDHRGNIREQKYETVKSWNKLSDDGTLDLDRLERLVDQFSRGVGDSDTSPTHQSRVVIVHDAAISRQVEEAKHLLIEEGWLDIENVACKGDIDGSAAVSHVRRFKFRIFVSTGKFQVTDMPSFMPVIDEGSNDDTLLLTRKSGLSQEIRHIHPVLMRNINGQNIFGRIHEFLSSTVSNSSEPIDEEANSSPRSGGLETPEEKIDDEDNEDDDDEEEQILYERYASLLKEKGFPDCYHDRKYANILIMSPLRGRNKNLRSIASIPWLRVFDFDPKSRVLGVLSNLEITLRSFRHVTVTDSKDRVEIPDDRTTNWVFINGYCDSDFNEFKDVPEIPSKTIFSHCDSLVNYCVGRKVPRIVVMWYSTVTNYDERLDRFMSGLQYHLESQLGSFSCILCMPENPNKHSNRGKMIKRLKLEKNVTVVPLKVLCKWIKKSDAISEPSSERKTLPQFSQIRGERGVFVLTEKDYKWLGVCFDVVASNELESNDEYITSGEDFLKGGKLGWQIIATKKYDAARDILAEKVNFVRKRYLETGKSGIITIFHPPGGGGTTFARRLLWELRKDSPCLELITMELSIDEVKKRLSFIRNETHLPAVLLIDGNSPMDVKTLLENCRYEKVIILHVQRFYSSHKALSKKKEYGYYLGSRKCIEN